MSSHREPTHHLEAVAEPPAEPIYCTLGPLLCRVRVFSETQWAAMRPSDRPAISEQVPGVGWVAAVPQECLN